MNCRTFSRNPRQRGKSHQFCFKVLQTVQQSPFSPTVTRHTEDCPNNLTCSIFSTKKDLYSELIGFYASSEGNGDVAVSDRYRLWEVR